MYGARRRAPARPSASSTGCPATRARRRCASATPPTGQFQLDVYGEVIDALHQARRLGARAEDPTRWALQHGHPRVPRDGAGTSPTRASGRCAARAAHFTHSKVMAWVAFDRAVQGGRGVRPRRARRPLAAVRDEIHARGLRARASTPSATRSSQSYGSQDARRQPADDPAGRLPARRRPARASAPSTAIERELMHDGFVLRYRRPTKAVDGLPPGEGAFLALHLLARRQPARCWAARDEARALFERLLALAQRRRPARPRSTTRSRGAHARQLPAGVLARVAGQHRPQPLAPARGRRTTGPPARTAWNPDGQPAVSMPTRWATVTRWSSRRRATGQPRYTATCITTSCSSS